MVTTQYPVNGRTALTFSAKRDVMKQTPVQQQAPQLPAQPDVFTRAAGVQAAAVKFGSTALYKGPFDSVKLITDYGVGKTEETSNNEIIDRFNRVLQFATAEIDRAKRSSFAPPGKVHGLALDSWVNNNHYQAGTLPINSISDIPGGNTDFASLGLVRLGGAENNKNIFIHVVDPGVGLANPQEHDRTILVTKKHGIYIGPNNGSLGSLYKRLQNAGEQPKLLQIDFNKIQAFERKRLKDPNYVIPVTIHGRDVFAVAGGLIAAGVKPEALAVTDQGKVKELAPVVKGFATPVALPGTPEDGEKQVHAIVDKTFGNLKLNVPYTDHQFNTLLQSGKKFQVKGPNGVWHNVPVKTKFSDVPQGSLLLYHGSSAGVTPGTRNLEIAANLDYASKKLGVSPLQAEPLSIRVVPDHL
jgi:S-adenosylmethionine hydrolase